VFGRILVTLTLALNKAKARNTRPRPRPRPNNPGLNTGGCAAELTSCRLRGHFVVLSSEDDRALSETPCVVGLFDVVRRGAGGA